MVQVLREAGIEFAGAGDQEILDADSGLRRWIAVPVAEDDEDAGAALQAVSRKLSITSMKSHAPAEGWHDIGAEDGVQLDS